MPPRQTRLDAPGTVHHVIIRGTEKRKIVNDDAGREKFVERMSRIGKSSQMIMMLWGTFVTRHSAAGEDATK